MITLQAFMAAVRENVARITHYEKGGDGSGGGCDCIGLIIGAMKLAGGKWPGTHGSNWAARNAMDGLSHISPTADMYAGQIVFKAKSPGEEGYDLPAAYDDSPDRLDYYHVGVVTGVDPLEITHCTSVPGGIQRDSKMGNWRWGGKIKYVNYNEGGIPMKPIYQAKVHAEGNDYPVKMREQASTKAAVMEKIQQGTVVDVLGIVGSDEGDWGFIMYNGQTGYMLNKFLIPISAETGGTDTLTVRLDDLEAALNAVDALREALQQMLRGE